jgi:hypothetical protein
MRRLIPVLLMLVAGNCSPDRAPVPIPEAATEIVETDEESLTRIRTAQSLARLTVLAATQALETFEDSVGSQILLECLTDTNPTATVSPTCQRQSALYKSISDARVQSELADRDYNRFMGN